jgi:hypothetical protein
MSCWSGPARATNTALMRSLPSPALQTALHPAEPCAMGCRHAPALPMNPPSTCCPHTTRTRAHTPHNPTPSHCPPKACNGQERKQCCKPSCAWPVTENFAAKALTCPRNMQQTCRPCWRRAAAAPSPSSRCSGSSARCSPSPTSTSTRTRSFAEGEGSEGGEEGVREGGRGGPFRLGVAECLAALASLWLGLLLGPALLCSRCLLRPGELALDCAFSWLFLCVFLSCLVDTAGPGSAWRGVVGASEQMPIGRLRACLLHEGIAFEVQQNKLPAGGATAHGKQGDVS